MSNPLNHTCLLCGSATNLIHLTHMKADYHHCDSCQFISKDSRFLIPEEEALKIYNYHNNSIEDPRYVAYFQRFLDAAVLPFASEGKEGFDFGSGPSPVLAQLLERDYGYAMDIYDLFYAPDKVYEEKKYQLVTTTEVVEHLQNPLPYFRLFKELLVPGGILAVMTQFHANVEADFIKWHYVRDHSHISFFTPVTMAYIASQTGLVVIYTDNQRYITFKNPFPKESL